MEPRRKSTVSRLRIAALEVLIEKCKKFEQFSNVSESEIKDLPGQWEVSR